MKPALAFSLLLILVLIPVWGVATSGWTVDSSPAVAQALSGSDPADALVLTCGWYSQRASSHLWYRIPPQGAKPVLVRLNSSAGVLSGLQVLVYSKPVEAGEEALTLEPVGYGQRTRSRRVLEWSGAPPENATYYAQVVNANPFSVNYIFCNPEE